MGSVIVNVEQAEAWNGVEGAHWVAHQERYDAMSGGFTSHLLAAAAIGAAESVLDVGCGNGKSTRLAAAQTEDGRAVGVDLSLPMLERARLLARDEGIANVTFEQADAQVHAFEPGAFDVAISRFGVMFFADPVAAFANIRSAVRPGGRLAFLCWRDVSENEWLMVPASGALQHVPFPSLGAPGAPGPFSLADRARIDEVLDGAGWTEVAAAPVDEPMHMGRDVADVVGFLGGTGIARALLAEADEETAARAMEAVGDALRPHETAGGIRLRGAAWVVTARA